MRQTDHPSFGLVVDNVDIMVTVPDMTSENQDKDNHNAVADRVNPVENSDEKNNCC